MCLCWRGPPWWFVGHVVLKGHQKGRLTYFWVSHQKDTSLAARVNRTIQNRGGGGGGEKITPQVGGFFVSPKLSTQELAAETKQRDVVQQAGRAVCSVGYEVQRTCAEAFSVQVAAGPFFWENKLRLVCVRIA